MSLHGPFTPSVQAFSDSAHLLNVTVPALRWRREPGGTINKFFLRIQNVSDNVASFKFQQSAAADASQDQIALITVAEDADPTTSSNFVQWYNQIGLFNASFTDIVGQAYSIVPGGVVIAEFTTTVPFVQIIPTVANNAKIFITGSTTQKTVLFINVETSRSPGETNNLSDAPGEPANVLDPAPADA